MPPVAHKLILVQAVEVKKALSLSSQSYYQFRTPVLIGWEHPPMGWVKLNTNGVAKGNPSIVRWGGLICDH